jgi:flagellar assembly protein FliH
LSNVIKAYTVRYEDEIKKTIDTHLRLDKVIEENRNKVITPKFAQFPMDDNDGQFVEGIKAVVVEALPSEEELKEKSDKIFEQANQEAQQILDRALLEAEQLKKEVYSSAQKKGYEDGLKQALLKEQKLKSEYEEKTRELHNKYEALVEEIEPRMADIIAALVEKLTGILVENKEDVILYLVEKALKNMDKCDEYTIKVSKDDYESVSERKNYLQDTIGREVTFYIVEDPNLMKNQCFIETDLRVLDCSLDVQLSRLTTDLKLLGRI